MRGLTPSGRPKVVSHAYHGWSMEICTTSIFHLDVKAKKDDSRPSFYCHDGDVCSLSQINRQTSSLPHQLERTPNLKTGLKSHPSVVLASHFSKASCPRFNHDRRYRQHDNFFYASDELKSTMPFLPTPIGNSRGNLPAPGTRTDRP